MADPIIVSYSELDTFRQCPLKHALAYKQRWTRPVKEDGALAKGTLWHSVLETHYQTIKHYTSALSRDRLIPEYQQEVLTAAKAAVAPLLQDRAGNQTEVQELIEWMYLGYVQQYGIDPDWQILATEHNMSMPLLTLGGRPSRFRLKAKIDLIVRDRTTGLKWVVDHKSGKDLPSKMDLDIDDQFGLYTALLRRAGDGVVGAIHNAARTYRTKVKVQALDERFGRTYLNRTDAELDAIERDAYLTARAAYSRTMDVPYSSPDPRQCSWKCDFTDVHLLARKGIDVEQALLDYGFRIDRTRH